VAVGPMPKPHLEDRCVAGTVMAQCGNRPKRSPCPHRSTGSICVVHFFINVRKKSVALSADRSALTTSCRPDWQRLRWPYVQPEDDVDH
jgi:hypothetical protein